MQRVFAVFVGIAAIGACTPAGESSASVEVSDNAGVTVGTLANDHECVIAPCDSDGAMVGFTYLGYFFKR